MGAGGRRKKFGLGLATLGMAALVATPLVGSAAVGDGFLVRAVNVEDPSINAVAGIRGTPAGETPVEVPSEPVIDGGVVQLTVDLSKKNNTYCDPASFGLPLVSGYRSSYTSDVPVTPTDATVDWGDGQTSEITSASILKHSYADTSKPYTITIDGTIDGIGFPGYYFNASAITNCIKSVDRMDASAGVRTLSDLFFQNSRTDLSVAEISSTVVDTSEMFRNANNFNGDTSNWNMSGVRDAASMFYFATNFSGQGVDKWNTSNFRTMDSMFYFSDFNGDVTAWKTGKVENMNSTFSNTYYFNKNISSWDVSKVKNMGAMFLSSRSFTQDLSGWNVNDTVSHSDFSKNSKLTSDKLPKFKS